MSGGAPVKSFFLNLRYTFGYLSSGFLVSVPLQIVQRFATPEHMREATQSADDILLSLIYGGACIGLHLLLIPVTRIDWSLIRLPEFKVWELRVVRNAFILSTAFLVACLTYRDVYGWLSLRVAWMVFILEGFAWASYKAQTLIFKDFYQVPEADPVRIALERQSAPVKRAVRTVTDAVRMAAIVPPDIVMAPGAETAEPAGAEPGGEAAGVGGSEAAPAFAPAGEAAAAPPPTDGGPSSVPPAGDRAPAEEVPPPGGVALPSEESPVPVR